MENVPVMGIPLTGEELLEREHNGVTYKFRVAVGPLAREVEKIQAEYYDFGPYVQQAAKEVDEGSRGKRWEAGERIKAVTERATELLTDKALQGGIGGNRNYIEAVLDLVCVGWSGNNVPPLASGGKPSDQLQLSVSGELVAWYMEQLSGPSEDQVKN